MMNRTFALRLVTALCAATLSSACATSPPKQVTATPSEDTPALPIPNDLNEEIARSIAIGRALYTIDMMSAVGTDVMLENVKDPKSSGIAGYITQAEKPKNEAAPPAFVVRFFTAETPPRVLYHVRIEKDAKPTFQAFNPPEAADPLFAQLVQARQLAIAALPAIKQPINPVLIPGEARNESGVLVYLLAGTKKPNTAVLGQHFRALVPLGGTGITSMTPLSKSVLEMPLRSPEGETPEALGVKHLVTDYPLETHVFTSLLIHLPIMVVTKRGVWKVDGDKITLISKDS